MLLNQDKCKCFHRGRANSKSHYKIHNAVLNTMHGYEGLEKNMFFRLKTGESGDIYNWALAKTLQIRY